MLIGWSTLKIITEKHGANILDQNRSIAMLALKKVVKSEREFYNVDDQTEVRLNKFDSINGHKLDQTIVIDRFSIIDLDGDEIPEVILVSDDIDYEILHYDNSKVFGYNMVIRALMDIKTDGSTSFSSSASEIGFGRVVFSKDSCDIQENVYSISKPQGDKTVDLYFKNQFEITESEFLRLIDEQNKKNDIIWYDFTEENIEKVFSMK